MLTSVCLCPVGQTSASEGRHSSMKPGVETCIGQVCVSAPHTCPQGAPVATVTPVCSKGFVNSHPPGHLAMCVFAHFCLSYFGRIHAQWSDSTPPERVEWPTAVPGRTVPSHVCPRGRVVSGTIACSAENSWAKRSLRGALVCFHQIQKTNVYFLTSSGLEVGTEGHSSPGLQV